MKQLDLFEQLVIDALGNVPQLYYATIYKNIESFRVALSYRSGRYVDDDFERYGERVFCYEFYHQLRILIDLVRTRNHNFLAGAELQGEVDKMKIVELIERLNLEELTKEFAPDFLMHSPGGSENHAFVIEVKCTNNLTPQSILTDLKKINEFVTRYHYQRGIFISVNSDYKYILKLLKGLSSQISELEGKEHIKVICKLNQESKQEIYQL